jgi:ppGpp synthetase/RelA/SpoT-type nucleotidyltranferase
MYIKKLKDISNKEYMFGDFDKDGVKNIDDPKPFNPKVSKYPKQADNPKYYHKARYGDGKQEVLLSEELKQFEKHNNKRSPILKLFLKENKGSYGRIKTVPSTMKKLRTRYLTPRSLTKDERKDNQVGIMDIAGVTVRTKDRKEANKKASEIKKKYRYDPRETDNYYKNPKGNVYFAHHIGLKHPKNKEIRVEVQVKSTKMDLLHDKMHKAYKRDKPKAVNKRFRKPAKKLFDLGF